MCAPNSTLNTSHFSTGGREWLRISYVVQAYHEVLVLAACLKKYPNMLVLTNEVMRQAYARGDMMLPDTFIYLWLSAHLVIHELAKTRTQGQRDVCSFPAQKPSHRVEAVPSTSITRPCGRWMVCASISTSGQR